MSSGKKSEKPKASGAKKVRVVLKRSLNGASKTQRQSAFCLGLRKINQTRVFKDSPALRGQVKKIQHLLALEVL